MTPTSPYQGIKIYVLEQEIREMGVSSLAKSVYN
jgi:hypothetical protein